MSNDNGLRDLLDAYEERKRQRDIVWRDYYVSERSWFARLRLTWHLLVELFAFRSQANGHPLATDGIPLRNRAGSKEFAAAGRDGDWAPLKTAEGSSRVGGEAAWEPFLAHAKRLDAGPPTVSVVIPVYNQLAMTLECLRSIAGTIDDELPIEIIVIDDHSSDAVSAALANIDGITVVRNGSNRGFLRSCNRGAALASGRYIHFLNNDTVVTAGWLRELVRLADSDERIGAVGSKLTFPDGSLQEAGGIIWRDGSGWNYGRNENPDDPRFNFVRDVDYISGASLMVRAGVFRGIGGFHEAYAPAYCEDSDLCFAVRKAGYRVVYQPKSVVVHLEGASSGRDIEKGVKRYQAVNTQKFIARWEEELRDHCPPDAKLAIRAARRLQAPRMLVMIDNYVPEYDQDSGSNKLLNIIRIFQDLGYSVTFVPANYYRSEPYTTFFQQMGVEIVYRLPGGLTLDEAIRERLAVADLVWVGRPELCSKFLPTLRDYSAPIVYDTHDLHYVRVKRELEHKSITDPERWRKWQDEKAVELDVVRSVDVALTVSDVERRTLESEGCRNVRVVPNIHEPVARTLAFDQTADVLFIGGYQHPPNVDAAVWLCKEIMPHVWRSAPEIKVHLLGSKPPRVVLDLASQRISVPGYIPDVGPYFAGARVFVAPLQYGAGLKGKVGHALSYGVPTVTTSIGAEGFDFVDGRDALVADEARAFAAAILRLYNEPGLWSTISRNSFAIVERYRDSAVKQLIAEVIQFGEGRRRAARATLIS